jgi:lipid-A-disaccharide synthase
VTERPVPREIEIMLIVGEASGDELGAQLIAALKVVGGGRIRITGVGGPAMIAEGMKPLFSIEMTAVMGLREVVPRIPAILRRVRHASDFAVKMRPDVLVIIDSPDFTHRIAQRVKRLDPSIPIVNYAPPQVWASRSYRAKKMARYIDAVITFFPFETEFFQRYGISSYAAGYPVIERADRMRGGDAFRSAHGIADDAPLIAVLPGSRRNEIRFILPIFKQAVELLARDLPGLNSVMPTVPHVAHLVRGAAADWPTPVHVVEENAERYAAFDAADAALAASGTVTSELALARTPMIAGYRLGWLTYALARPFIHVPYIVLINLVLQRQAIPEFVQQACTPAALANALKPLFHNGPARVQQLHDLEAAVTAFGLGGEAPSIRAARAVLEIAEKRLAPRTGRSAAITELAS